MLGEEKWEGEGGEGRRPWYGSQREGERGVQDGDGREGGRRKGEWGRGQREKGIGERGSLEVPQRKATRHKQNA